MDAIAANLPGSRLAMMRDALRSESDEGSPEEHAPAVKAKLLSVYDQLGVDSVNAQFDRLLDCAEDMLSDAFEHLDNARADVLSLTQFSGGIWQ